MAFTQRQLDDLVQWAADVPELSEERAKARATYFGDDDPRPVSYWGGSEERASRQRRFLGYFLFTHQLPDGRIPAEMGASTLFAGSERDDALRAVRRARYVMAIVRTTLPGKAVTLGIEKERFEVRHRDWSWRITPRAMVYAHLVPSRADVWLLGPGWVELPFELGPNMRSHLSDFQASPIDVERLLQNRSDDDDDAELPPVLDDTTLEDAVNRMTAEAEAADVTRLIMTADEWKQLVLSYHVKTDVAGFSRDILGRIAQTDNLAVLNRWTALANNVWNNTPQPDRGGKTPNELVQERMSRR